MSALAADLRPESIQALRGREPVLDISGLGKRFGPVQALDDVAFTLERGEVHALLGVNGAGKSTFIKVLSGVIVKDAGTIRIDGVPVDLRVPRDAIDRGIVAVQQHPELVAGLSGYENIFLGNESARSGFLARLDRAALRRRGDALVARFPVDIDLSRTVGTMSVVEREIVAVLQALSRDDIRVLILDEPTSTLTEVEKDVLFRLMATLRRSGIAIVYITHRLEEVFEIADRITVFRGGCNVATMVAADARRQGISLPELMIGEALGHVYPPRPAPAPEPAPVLSVRKLARAGAFEDVSFDVRRGEILGIFGLVGSGLDELSKSLFGAEPAGAGSMAINGRAVAPRTPREALRAGIFLVPGDRRSEGLTLGQPALFNMVLADLGRASGLAGLLRWRRNQLSGRVLAQRVALTPPAIGRHVASFSGGNQQKIVVAKGLFTEATVYIFVEPTVGVDIGARTRLYLLMRELADRSAVIVMSTDCDEVHGLADRSFALYRGSQVSAPAAGVSRRQLMAAGIMGSVQ